MSTALRRIVDRLGFGSEADSRPREQSVSTVSFSANRSVVVSAPRYGPLVVWDPETGRRLRDSGGLRDVSSVVPYRGSDFICTFLHRSGILKDIIEECWRCWDAQGAKTRWSHPFPRSQFGSAISLEAIWVSRDLKVLLGSSSLLKKSFGLRRKRTETV